MKKSLFFLTIFTIFSVFSCNQQSEKTKVHAIESKGIESKGYIVPKDSMAVPKVIRVEKLKKVSVVSPKVVIVPTNIHPVVNPKVVLAGLPKICTPGQDTFAFPETVHAIGERVLAGLPYMSAAQSATTKDKNPNSFSIFGKLQGLNNITCLYEDKKGNMWFGGNGIAKYDGKNFARFGDKEGFTSSGIYSVLEDSKGNMWFGTYSSGLIKYDGRFFTHFTEKNGLLSNLVTSIIEDDSGYIWIASLGSRGGLNKFDGQSFTHFTQKQGLASNYVNVMTKDKAGNLWFGTIHGINKYDGKSFTQFTVKEGLIDNTVKGIITDKGGNLWVSTSDGVCKYDGKSFIHFTEKDGLINHDVPEMLEDKNGHIWFATEGGLSEYDGHSFTNFTEKQGLSSIMVRHILMDRYGKIWLGTFGGGVCKYDGQSFNHFTKEEGLIDNSIRTITEDKKGNLWIGTVKGVCQYKYPKGGKSGSFTYFTMKEGLCDDWVNNIIEDRSGNMWFATDGGVCKYDGQFFTYFLTKDGLAEQLVRCVLEDKNGNLWFGTVGGVSLFKPNKNGTGGTFTNFTTKEGLSSNDIWDMLEDSLGNMWFGTARGGVTQLTPNKEGNGGRFTQFRKKDGLCHDEVWDIREDKKGNMWFATEGGISKYTPNSGGSSGVFTNFSEQDGLNYNEVNALTEDKKGNMWFGTGNGLSLLAEDYEKSLSIEDNFQDSNKSPILFKNLTYENGFLGLGCGRNAMYTAKNGTIWIGAMDRLTALQPENVAPNTTSPNIQLNGIALFNENIKWQYFESNKDTNFLLGNGVKVHDVRFEGFSKWYNVPENLSLAYNNNYVTFNFVGITTESPRKVQYQFRLEGLDKNWSKPTFSSEAHYGNLSQGKYTFVVKAMNSEGYWSKELSYTFTIRPPFWRTWWFILLSLFTTMALVGYIVYLRLSKIIDLQEVRIKLYENLHDDLGSRLTAVVLTIDQILMKRNKQVPSVFSQEHTAETKNLTDTKDIVRSIVSNMRRLVWATAPENDELRNVVQQMTTDARILLPQTVVFDVQIAETLLRFKIDGNKRYQMLSILNEALTNIAKYAEATTVTVMIERMADSLCQTIRDNGNGFDLNKPFEEKYNSSGHGLVNMSRRAKRIKGTLTIESALGKGTVIRLSFPLQSTTFFARFKRIFSKNSLK